MFFFGSFRHARFSGNCSNQLWLQIPNPPRALESQALPHQNYRIACKVKGFAHAPGPKVGPQPLLLKLVSYTGCICAIWLLSPRQCFYPILRPVLADSVQSLVTGRQLRDPCRACLAGSHVCLLPAHRCPASLSITLSAIHDKQLQEGRPAEEPCKSRDRLQQLVDDALGPLPAKAAD